MHETSSNALLIHFHSAPYALHNAPFDLGIKRATRLDMPDGKVLDVMVDFSDAMGVMGLRRWRPTHAAGLARHRWSPDGPHASLANAQATAAVQRWAGDAGMPRRCVSHRCDRAFCRGGNFSECQGQLGFGSHLGSIDNRLFLYTFGIIVGDTNKFQSRATGVQLLHCCHLMGDGRWTAMATRAFPCR